MVEEGSGWGQETAGVAGLGSRCVPPDGLILADWGAGAGWLRAGGLILAGWARTLGRRPCRNGQFLKL